MTYADFIVQLFHIHLSYGAVEARNIAKKEYRNESANIVKDANDDFYWVSFADGSSIFLFEDFIIENKGQPVSTAQEERKVFMSKHYYAYF